MSYLAPALLLAGYAAVMFANPARASFADGWRCVRRYSVVWRLLALLGFAHALFHLAVRLVLHFELAPELTWFRAKWFDSELWLAGSPESIWWLPSAAILQVLRECVLPTFESLAGLFNNAITTFPLAVIAAVGLFFNRHGYATALRVSLRKRFGAAAWLILAAVYVGALSVIVKAALYFLLPVMANVEWFRWAPVIASVAAAFEYLVGVAIQIYLILFAYAWVRGLSFNPDALREVAVRRLGACAKWAGLVVAGSSFFIELPLALRNFPAFSGLLPDSPAGMETRVTLARGGLALALLGCASMQVWLALHGETLRSAWRAHWRFLRRHWWEFAWFLVVAGIHLFAVQVLRSVLLRGLGENIAPGIVWTLVWPWLNGLVVGWCLAAWVCLFKRCESSALR